MENTESIIELKVKEILLDKTKENILKFFSSKRFLFISFLSFIYIVFSTILFVVYINNIQELFINFNIDISNFYIPTLIISGFVLLIFLFTPIIIILLHIFSVVNKPNTINKILKINSIYYQIYRIILYVVVISYIIFLVFTAFFGLRLIDSRPMDYIGFYFVFYLLSIVFFLLIFFYINMAKNIIDMSKKMIYNLDGFEDNFVRGEGLKFSLYMFIFINIIYISVFFASYRNIEFQIINEIINTSNIQYNYPTMLFWMILITIITDLISIFLIRHINRHTFYVDAEEIRKSLEI